MREIVTIILVGMTFGSITEIMFDLMNLTPRWEAGVAKIMLLFFIASILDQVWKEKK